MIERIYKESTGRYELFGYKDKVYTLSTGWPSLDVDGEIAVFFEEFRPRFGNPTKKFMKHLWDNYPNSYFPKIEFAMGVNKVYNQPLAMAIEPLYQVVQENYFYKGRLKTRLKRNLPKQVKAEIKALFGENDYSSYVDHNDSIESFGKRLDKFPALKKAMKVLYREAEKKHRNHWYWDLAYRNVMHNGKHLILTDIVYVE